MAVLGGHLPRTAPILVSQKHIHPNERCEAGSCRNQAISYAILNGDAQPGYARLGDISISISICVARENGNNPERWRSFEKIRVMGESPDYLSIVVMG